MLTCGPRCPLVKADLRKIVTKEATWIGKEISAIDDKVEETEKTLFESSLAEEKLASGHQEAKRYDTKERAEAKRYDTKERAETSTQDPHEILRLRSDKVITATSSKRSDATETEPFDAAEPAQKVAVAPAAQIDQAILTDKSETDQNVQAYGEVDTGQDFEILQEARYEPDAGTRTEQLRGEASWNEREKGSVQQLQIVSRAGASKFRATQTPDRSDTSEQPVQIDYGEHGDEYDPNSPRQISRRNRLGKLEERQRILDAYLLHKGTGYFDDVCTCSLSCVIRALRDDCFARSLLVSATLFALGLKLSSELDAWYMPIQF